MCVISTVVRGIIGASTPLFPDETYYWEWSRRLAAGYFDHPPVIAWITALGTAVFGPTPFGVRVVSVLLGGVAAVCLCAAARRLGGDRAAFMAALVFATMPLSAAGLILATPDAPLLAFSAAAWYGIVRALDAPRRSRDSLTWWSLSGVALGFAFASKYTSILLPAAVLLGMLSSRGARARLRDPEPYVAAIIALVVFLPVLIWNANHAWISLAFQVGHGLGRARGSIVGRELELIGGQAGLVSPVIFVLLVVATWKGWSERAGTSTARMLAVSAAFTFVFFMYSATKRRAEANWPAPAYLPALLLLVSPAVLTAPMRRWLRIGLGMAAALTSVTYVNAFAPMLPVPAPRDPAARAYGWDDLASAVEALPEAASPRTLVAADRYQEASELAFHLSRHPQTFALNMVARGNQYDLWPSLPRRAAQGDTVILILDELPGTPTQITQLVPHFDAITRGALVPLRRRSGVVKNLRIWVLRGWRGTWPTAALRSRS